MPRFYRIRWGLWLVLVMGLVGAASGAWAQAVQDEVATASPANPSGPKSYVVQEEYPLYKRMGLWDGTQFNRLTGPGTISASRVYVLVHGWGIGSQASVEAYTGPKPVEVWNPEIVDFDKKPAGDWVTAMAAAIQAKDPQAAILAYTWLDDSATDENPLSAYISESHAGLNGRRLALAVPEAVGPGYQGQIHLIGFSHGSKVATMAALYMPIQPVQLTILDSPEKLLTRLGGAANGLQYYLPLLNIGRGAGQIFVDNYYSEFGGPFNGYPGLKDVVDVNLSPINISTVDFASRHFYAPEWYNKAVEGFSPGQTSPVVGLDLVQGQGIGWSPLFGTAYQQLLPSYLQQWAGFGGRPAPERELNLLGTLSFNNPFLQTTQTPLDITATQSQGDVAVDAQGTVVLDDSTGSAYWTAEFDLTDHDNGILVDYQFLNPGNGDQLAIWLNDKLRFVMTGKLVGASNPARSAISISAIEAGHMKMTVALHKFGDSQARVSVGNFLKATNPSGESLPILLDIVSLVAQLINAFFGTSFLVG